MAHRIRKEWFYIFRHPITDTLSVRGQEFRWDGTDWQLPDDQTHLPHMENQTEFYATEQEARDAISLGTLYDAMNGIER